MKNNIVHLLMIMSIAVATSMSAMDKGKTVIVKPKNQQDVKTEKDAQPNNEIALISILLAQSVAMKYKSNQVVPLDASNSTQENSLLGIIPCLKQFPNELASIIINYLGTYSFAPILWAQGFGSDSRAFPKNGSEATLNHDGSRVLIRKDEKSAIELFDPYTQKLSDEIVSAQDLEKWQAHTRIKRLDNRSFHLKNAHDDLGLLVDHDGFEMIGCILSNDQKKILSCDKYKVCIWDASTLELIQIIYPSKNQTISCAHFNATNSKIVVATFNHTLDFAFENSISVYDAQSCEKLSEVALETYSHYTTVSSATHIADESLIVACLQDTQRPELFALNVYDAKTGHFISALSHNAGAINEVSTIQRADMIALSDETIQLYSPTMPTQFTLPQFILLLALQDSYTKNRKKTTLNALAKKYGVAINDVAKTLGSFDTNSKKLIEEAYITLEEPASCCVIL